MQQKEIYCLLLSILKKKKLYYKLKVNFYDVFIHYTHNTLICLKYKVLLRFICTQKNIKHRKTKKDFLFPEETSRKQ